MVLFNIDEKIHYSNVMDNFVHAVALQMMSPGKIVPVCRFKIIICMCI